MDLYRSASSPHIFHRNGTYLKVRIPSPLHSYTANKSLVHAIGGTLNELTYDLDRQFRGIRFRFIDEQDQIRPHVKIFHNGVQVSDLGLALKDSDEIALVQAFSGG